MSWETPVLKGFNFKGGTSIKPEYIALTFALSYYTACFIAENVRGGILAISKGQTEAAHGLGLRPQDIATYCYSPGSACDYSPFV